MNEQRSPQEDEKERKREEMRKQAVLINQLATRLPWIVLALSFVAFIVIFLQAFLRRP